MNRRAAEYRLATSAAVMLLAFCSLGFRLAFLHLGPHAEMRDRVTRTRQWRQPIHIGRGMIFDRHGRDNMLALDVEAHNVCADPSAIAGRAAVGEIAQVLSETLRIPAPELAVRLNRPQSRYVRLKRFVPEEQLEALRERALDGIFFEREIRRFYPHGPFLCHVLGFVNDEGKGSAGVEQLLNGYLKGAPGLLESQKNALRQELYWRRQRVIPAMQGADVVLTLDQNVQHIAEKALDAVMEEHRPKGAWCIVQRIGTGEILAMAARPHYDLNAFRTSREDERLNRAIGHVFEPGSTLKAVVVAAALNERLVVPETELHCENGFWIYGNRPLRDTRGYGELSVADILKKSSNIGTAKIALALGNERLETYLRTFGIGDRLGIDLPGEEHGILHPARNWSAICPTRIAIGQGVSATALQILGAFCAIANRGALMRPYVTRSVIAADGSVLLRRTPEIIARPIDEQTAQTMCRLLTRVTEEGGTGRRAQIDGYAVAGKTGTAQKPEGGGYSATGYVASFVGFVPADAPQLGIIVVVDEPGPSYYGGVVAAPAFRQVASESARYLGLAVHGGLAAAAKP